MGSTSDTLQPETQMERVPPNRTEVCSGEDGQYKLTFLKYPGETRIGPILFSARNDEAALRHVANLLRIRYPLDLAEFTRMDGLGLYRLGLDPEQQVQIFPEIL